MACVLIIFAFNISGDLNSFQKRTDFLEKSFTIIKQLPFTGTGIGSYLIAQHNYPQKFSTFFEQPVHNIFLLIIAQLGIPLSVLLLTLIFRNINLKKRGMDFLLPFFCVVLTGTVDHYWITLQQNQLVLALLFGILFSYEKKTSRT
jgi:O-antigen ligase